MMLPTNNLGTLSSDAHKFLDLLPLGACIVDDRLIVHAWSQLLADWTHVAASQIVGRALTEIFPSLDQRKYHARLAQVFETGSPAIYSAALHKQFIPVISAQGEPMIQETRVRRFSASPPLALITIQDLTNEYQQLAQLRRERLELQKAQHDLEEANHALQSSLQLQWRNFQKLQSEVQERAKAEEELRRQTENLTLARQREAEQIDRQAKLIEELTVARQQADAAVRSKNEFLANMSHEIRTPMTAILGFVEVLRDQDLPADQRAETAALVHRNGEHLLSIINDILDMSKLEAGRLLIERTTCAPQQLLIDAVNLLRPRAAERRLALELQFDPGIPETIDSDPTRLRQIVLNLLGNALKFTTTGGVYVHVKFIELPVPRLQFSVRDTGIGIALDRLASLFTPFSQGGNAVTREFGGTGLGLAISRRLALMLGGDITVESQRGVGSTFTVTIHAFNPSFVSLHATTGAAAAIPGRGPAPAPHLYLPQTSPALEPLTAGPASTASGPRVLVVDDTPDNRRLISFLLGKISVHPDLAENGAEAVARVRAAAHEHRPYQLVLMDMQMPIMNGYDAVKQLRADGNRVPIIALTAFAMTGDREKCLQAGCDDYITKPIQRQLLYDLVKHYTSGGVPSSLTAPSSASQSISVG